MALREGIQAITAPISFYVRQVDGTFTLIFTERNSFQGGQKTFILRHIFNY